MLVCVVAPRDYGATEHCFCAKRVKHRKVFKYQPVFRSRIFFVKGRVCHLVIEKKNINEGSCLFVVLRSCVTTGLHTGVQTVFFCQGEELQGEFELHHRLTAGKRHAAPRCIVKYLVAENLLHNRVCIHGFSCHLNRSKCAILGTFTAYLAKRAVINM